jgi:hypothetical protein
LPFAERLLLFLFDTFFLSRTGSDPQEVNAAANVVSVSATSAVACGAESTPSPINQADPYHVADRQNKDLSINQGHASYAVSGVTNAYMKGSVIC